MKKLFIMLIIAAFAVTALTAMAQGTEKAKKADKKIWCCIKGECKEMAKTDCTKAKGRVVPDCGKCKAVKASKSPTKADSKTKPEPKLDSE